MTAKESISRAALIISAAALLSKVLGFLRDIVIAAKFGTSNTTDAFLVALTLPEFFIDVLAGGALTSAFIPVFSGYLAKEENEEASRIFSTIFNLLLMSLIFITALFLLNSTKLLGFIAPGFSEETLKLAVKISYIIIPSVIFMGLASYLSGVLHSTKYFLLPALRQTVLNICIILSALFFARLWDIKSLAVGFLAGSVIQLLMLVPAVIRRKFKYTLCLSVKHQGIKNIGAMWIPLIIALVFSNAVGIIVKMFASTLPEGRIAALHFAHRLKHLPIVVFGVTLATAIFPFITWQAAEKNMEKFKSSVTRALKIIFFITFPLCLGMAVFRVPMVRIFFERGSFTEISTQLTSSALMFYLPGAVAVSLTYVIIRAFYALKDTVTPLKATVFGLSVMLALGWFLKNTLMHDGLAIAHSISETVIFIYLFVYLMKKTKIFDLPDILMSFVKIAAVSVVSVMPVGFLYSLLNKNYDLESMPYQIGAVLISGCVSVLLYMVFSGLLKVDEAGYFLKIIKKKLNKGANNNEG
ncbi:murein biosynthesis integral membrane protein MurJ [Elusimicrobiota bacterium]